MPEGILDFFELVWAESQSLDSRESKKDILYTGTKSLPCTSAAADGLQQRGVGSAVLHVSPEYYLRITAHGKLQVSREKILYIMITFRRVSKSTMSTTLMKRANDTVKTLIVMDAFTLTGAL